MTEVTRQRIEHLKLQGFTPEQASKMQNVSIWEVEKIFFGYELYQDNNQGETLVIDEKL